MNYIRNSTDNKTMDKMVKFLQSSHWRNVQNVLSDISNLYIFIIDDNSRLINDTKSSKSLPFIKTDGNDFISYYKKFLKNLINENKNDKVLVEDLFGMHIALIPLNNNYYLLINGGLTDETVRKESKFYKRLEQYGVKTNKHSLNLNTYKEFERKINLIEGLYKKMINSTMDSDELGHKSILLKVVEEINKLILELFDKNEFKLRKLLELVVNSLMILFDATGAFVYCCLYGECEKVLNILDDQVFSVVDEILDKDNWKTVEDVKNELSKQENMYLEFIENNDVFLMIGIIDNEISSYKIKDALNIFAKHVFIGLEIKKLVDLFQMKVGYLLEYIRHGFILINNDGHIMLANESASRIFHQVSCKLSPGINISETVLPEFIQNAVQNTLNYGEKYFEKEVAIDNEEDNVYIKYDVTPLIDNEENIHGAIIILEDITEHIYLRKQMSDFEKLSVARELAAGFAHEIRNPLQVASGTLQLMEIINNESRKEELFLKLKDELKRINDIVTNFLEVSRPDKDKEFETFNITKILNEILFLLKGDANLNDIEISYLKNEDNLMVNGNPDTLKQVFLNIGINAIEAMEKGGKLDISVESDDIEIRVKFRDNGPGIPENIQKNIFRPFFTTKSEGTGLGLAISYRLIKEMGGDISVSSKLGEGTEFTIVFVRIKEHT